MVNKINSKQYSGSKTNNPKKKSIIWKPIWGFSKYVVSSNGKVMNIKSGKCLKPCMPGGYYCVSMRNNQGKKKTNLVHRFVAQCFIKNINNYDQVDHIDNNKLNNNVSNLRWATQTINSKSYHDNFKAKRIILQSDINGNIIKKWNSMNDIMALNPSYNRKVLNNNIRGQSKSAYKYVWKHEVDKPKPDKYIIKTDEIFKNIAEIENYSPGEIEIFDLSDYRISNYGTVMNNQGNILSQNTGSCGYMKIGQRKKLWEEETV